MWLLLRTYLSPAHVLLGIFVNVSFSMLFWFSQITKKIIIKSEGQDFDRPFSISNRVFSKCFEVSTQFAHASLLNNISLALKVSPTLQCLETGQSQ